ncbi:hypothetical protein RvY_08050-2 [Ramazzottius varieornatus]|uniref:G-protein coupled receptors family 1 profile domain-containing protein n=1 Tax=Ramazzottius varieornatus TaxID=947166 RepID=A0A1D1VDP1_RAMVA|nr:hypothetical protein RvY_08050-2 [Ramazzottius varieornatus]
MDNKDEDLHWPLMDFNWSSSSMGDTVQFLFADRDNFTLAPSQISTIFDEPFRKIAVKEYLETKLLGPQRASLEILIPMCFFYVLIFITGTVGNTVTVWVISKNPRMHSGGTNYYLINLAISDLISLILGLPFEVYQLFEEYPYPFPEPFCQARAWVSEASTLSSVFTILAFTVERYVAICHPFKNIHFRTKSSRVILTIMISWILAFTAAGPMGLEFSVLRFPYPSDTLWAANMGGVDIPESAVCTARAEGPMVILIQFSTFVFFFLPMFVIVALHISIALHLRRSSYLTRESVGSEHSPHHTLSNGATTVQQQISQMTQGRQAVLKMLVAVALAFFVCYAPHHAQRMHAVYEKHWDHNNMFIHRVLTYISGVFYYGASTVNPFLYSILSARFRKAYRSTLCYCLYPRAEIHHEQYSIHSINSQALGSSLRYRPSSSVDELAFLSTRQNSLLAQNNLNCHERLSLKHPINSGHSLPAMPLNLVWGKSKKFLVPVSNVNGVRDALVIYCPKQKKKDKKGKIKSRVRAKPHNEQDETSSISGSSLQEREIDPEQVSDFLSKGRTSTPRLVVHPPSESGSGNSNSNSRCAEV